MQLIVESLQRDIEIASRSKLRSEPAELVSEERDSLRARRRRRAQDRPQASCGDRRSWSSSTSPPSLRPTSFR
jgi:hypothetical protein